MNPRPRAPSVSRSPSAAPSFGSGVPLDVSAGTPSSFLAASGRGLIDPVSGYRYVVSVRPIARGETVAVFGGTVVTRVQLGHLGPGAASRSLQVEEDLFLYSDVDGPGDWINHACDPNLELRGQIVLAAVRDIEPGEELTFDYATAEGSSGDEFPCSCGSPNCRGSVGGGDWGTWLAKMSARPEALDTRGLSPYLGERVARVRAGRGLR